MDQVDNFINAKDTLRVLTELRKKELEWVDKKRKASTKGMAHAKPKKRACDSRREEAPPKGHGFRFDQPVLTIHQDDR